MNAATPDRWADRAQRAERVNAFIETIAGCGRGFFKSPSTQAISRLEVDHRGRTWYLDKYSGRRIYTHYRYAWDGFTEGGTLETLVRKLCVYISTGTPQRLGLGPWPDWVVGGGDLWGYGDHMEQVRAKAAELGIAAVAGEVSG